MMMISERVLLLLLLVIAHAEREQVPESWEQRRSSCGRRRYQHAIACRERRRLLHGVHQVAQWVISLISAILFCMCFGCAFWSRKHCARPPYENKIVFDIYWDILVAKFPSYSITASTCKMSSLSLGYLLEFEGKLSMKLFQITGISPAVPSRIDSDDSLKNSSKVSTVISTGVPPEIKIYEKTCLLGIFFS